MGGESNRMRGDEGKKREREGGEHLFFAIVKILAGHCHVSCRMMC